MLYIPLALLRHVLIWVASSKVTNTALRSLQIDISASTHICAYDYLETRVSGPWFVKTPGYRGTYSVSSHNTLHRAYEGSRTLAIFDNPTDMSL
jgi:hypothetical protein